MNPATPLSGSLLAALPSLKDPHFRRTILFLTHHSADEGALGFVLNRPRGAVFGDLSDVPEDIRGVQVFEGGPVGRDGVIVASISWTEEGAAFAPLEEKDLPDHPEKADLSDLRAFTGYAGWSAGQLEEEIEEGSWRVIPPREDLMAAVSTIEEGVAVWRRIMREISPWQGLLAEAPDDLSLN
jgi:putative transcriptional regulator